MSDRRIILTAHPKENAAMQDHDTSEEIVSDDKEATPMTRRIILTADEAAQVRTTVEAGGGTVWIVREGADCTLGTHCYTEHDANGQHPPSEFVAACQPCTEPMCRNGRVLYPEWEGRDQPCPDCRIELVGPCPEPSCDACGDECQRHRHYGRVYAVGQPLPIIDGTITHAAYPPDCLFTTGTEMVHDADFEDESVTAALARYGPPESLVGKWALQVQVTP